MARNQTQRMSDLPEAEPAGLPSGSLALDLALGTGGWARGRVAEVYGPAAGGKTTLLLHAIASAQRAGGMGALIDADHATSQQTAARLGIDLERMPYHRTTVLEEALEKVEELVRGGSVDVIAVDGFGALLPKYYHEASAQDSFYHHDEKHQFKIDVFLKCILGPLATTRTVLLVSNPIRLKVGVIYGSPETTPWATLPLQDYASQRIDLRKTGAIKDGDSTIGTEVRAKVVKNRFAPPTQVDLEVYHATGISHERDLLRLGLDARVLTKRGTHLTFDDESLGNGTQSATARLREDGDLAARLEAAIRASRQG